MHASPRLPPAASPRRRRLPPVLAALAAVTALAALLALFPPPAAAVTPQVLILNSYHQGEDWSDNELAGILPALRAAYPDLVPVVEHLDAKRHPGPAHLLNLQRFLAEKYRGRRLDLIMILDNPALDLFLAHRAELFPGIPAVFAGINGFLPEMLAGQEKITGITEEQDMAGTLRLALGLRPGTKSILAIHDHTSSGLAVRRDMDEALAEAFPEFVGRVEIAFTPPAPFAELERTLRALPPDALAVILSYVTDGAGRTLTRAESTQLISQASPVPVLGMHETRLGHGIVGGSLISGEEHGRHAAGLALLVLAGEDAGAIPVVYEHHFRAMFDHAQLERFAIPEAALPPGSLIVNRPVSYYEQNRLLILSASGVVMLLAALTLLLFLALLRGRRAQAALREREQSYRTVFEAASDAIVLLDIDSGAVLDANRKAFTAIGLRSLGEFRRNDFWLDPPYSRAEARQWMRKAAAEGPQVFEWLKRRADGEDLWEEVDLKRVSLGGEDCLMAISRDITERKHVQEALRLSEQRYRELFNSVSDLVFSHDRQGRFLAINAAVAALMGYTPREIIGRTPGDFMKPALARAYAAEYLEPLLARGQASGITAYRHKDGSQRYLEYRSQVVEPAEGLPFVSGVARDVTARVLQERRLRQLEEQLRQSQKMEAVGTLAGGIAHDFNNILAAVLGFAELGLESAENGQGNAEEIRQIIQAAERARGLVRHLLTFSRKLEPQTQAVDMNLEVAHALEMLSRTIPKMISLERSLAPGLWTVLADPIQVEQVLINLGSNAVDAMPEGGCLSLATANLELTPELAPRHHQMPPGRYVLLTVADTGQGMDSRTQEQIFDPFFSTKEVGKGTGLGLAMVYGIVQGHGGQVFCDSLPGRGTTFSIYLPVAAEQTAAAGKAGAAGARPRGNGEGVLLVDDEGMLRALGERLLGAAGYKVRVAGSGEEALLALEDPACPVDLVVLDLGMPGMGGLKCLERILARDPGARVVIASGYAADGPVRQALTLGAAGFVAKPYGRTELLTTVRQTLGSPRPA